MSEIQYNVRMYTPMGEKKGTLTAERRGNELKGWLNILGHKEPFEGVVDKVGNCRITGLYITLLRDVSYVATGKISSSSIHLQVKGERNVFAVWREHENYKSNLPLSPACDPRRTQPVERGSCSNPASGPSISS